MKVFIVLSALVAACVARPGLLASPLAYSATPLVYSYSSPIAYAKLVPGAPIGLDGRVVDTPEVSHAKAEHAAAHINEKISLAEEAVKSADYITYAAAPAVAATPLVATTYAAAPAVAATPLVATTYAAAAPALTLTKYTAGGAPIGLDGRVVDTPEVAHAKAEHAAARINHNIEKGQEYARNSLYGSSPLLVSSYASPAYATGYVQNYW